MAELIYATPHDISTLEPTQVSGWADHTAALAIFGSLVMNFDGSTGKVGYFPWLAQRVEPCGDHAWEIELRPGLRFHDGQPLDAEALRYSFERVLAAGFPSKRYMHTAPISRIEVAGPLVLILHTTKPIAILPARLFRADASAVAPSCYGPDSDKSAMRPVGAGPFRFDHYLPGNRLVLSTNVDFIDPRGYPRPNFDRLVLRTIADPGQLLSEMTDGRIDIAPLTPDQVEMAEPLPGWRIVSGPDTSRMSFEINQRAHPALADRRVRQAINHAIDVDGLLRQLTGGAGRRIASLVNPPNADPAVVPYAYDPDRARALIAEAGFAEGFPIDIDWSTGPDRGRLAEAMVPYLDAVGIIVGAVRECDWSRDYVPGQMAGTLAGLHGHGHAGVEMTAETDLWPLHPRRDANSTNWVGPAADRFVALYGELQQATNPQRQAALGNALQRITHSEAISVPFWQMPRFVAVAERVEHYLPYPGGHNEDFWTIRLAENGATAMGSKGIVV